jgi:hypothetical protein
MQKPVETSDQKCVTPGYREDSSRYRLLLILGIFFLFFLSSRILIFRSSRLDVEFRSCAMIISGTCQDLLPIAVLLSRSFKQFPQWPGSLYGDYNIIRNREENGLRISNLRLFIKQAFSARRLARRNRFITIF